MRNRLIRSGFTLIMVSILFVACRKEHDDDAGATNTAAMAGEWWVQIKVNNALVAPDFFKVLTYNTAENVATKMWIDDQEHIWPFKLKIDVDPAAKSFSAANATSEYTSITVKLANGKMLDKVSKGPVSNAVTDSIYFEAEFSDDPGTTYQFSGYKRTRWPEDDH
jgi:Lipid-binding putative hydrolase